MKLRKVISGGQTGADRTGLECGREMGLETGGTAPLHFRTETGRDPSLKVFGLVESPYESYPPRTEQNVKDSDVTLWFGNTNSPGYYCTLNACKRHKKELVANPSAERMREIALAYEVVNVAGNRASTNPDVIKITRTAFKALKELL